MFSLLACESHETESAGKFPDDQKVQKRKFSFLRQDGARKTTKHTTISRGSDLFINDDALSNTSTGTAIVIPVGGQKVQMNLVNASIPAAAEAVLGQALKRSFVIGSNVTGRITIQTTGSIPKSALFDLFKIGLEANNARIEQKGKVIQILQGSSGAKNYTSANYRNSNNGSIVVAPLQYISATQMSTLLQPSIDDGLKVSVDKKRNLILLSGNKSQIDSGLDAINLFDVDVLRGKSVALIPLEAADADAVVEELELIFETKEGGSLQDVVQFVANPRLKSILVITTRSRYLADAQKWIRDLDRTAGSANRYSQIYELQNRSAQNLAPILAELMSAEVKTVASNSSDVANIVNDFDDSKDKIQILADDAQNVIVARALKKEHEELRQLIARLDTNIKQVLLEATIVEVTLNDDVNLGVGWFFQSGNFKTTFATNNSGTIGPNHPGFSAVFGSNNASVALNALSSVTDVKVISSPTLMVLDNKEAVLQIGDQVPIATQSAVDTTNPNAPIVSTIDYRDTGVILRVKPRISNGNRVVLDITQEVSDVVSTTTSGIDSPTIRQRQVQTTVMIDSGSTLALGGIIQERDNDTNTKVPGIGDVPILGALFRNKPKKSLRTELLILIRPTIVNDSADARSATNYWRQRLSGPNKLLKTGLGQPKHRLPDLIQ